MSTYVQRIALLAQRLNIPIVSTSGQTHLGLYGTLRFHGGTIGISCSAKLPALIKDIDPALEFETILAAFSRGDAWAWIQIKTPDHKFRTPERDKPLPQAFIECSEGILTPDDFRLVLGNSQLALVCQLSSDGGSLKAIYASSKIYRPSSASLIVADFGTTGERGLDLRGFCSMVAMQIRVRTAVNVRAVEAEAAADRDFVTGVRRYLEALRDHARSSTPQIRYQISERSPVRLRTATEEPWPLVFARPNTQLVLPTLGGRSRRLAVCDVSDDGVLTLDGDDEKGDLASDGELHIQPGTDALQRMREALDVIAMGAEDSHVRLIEALTRPDQLQPLPPIHVPAIHDEAGRQQAAKALALNTPDIALIHGPPGTGKTTVICGIVQELVRSGKRVLLVAPTHVALDNVLERVGNAPGVTAIRLGSPANVDVRAQNYLLQNRTLDLTARLSTALHTAVEDAAAEDAVVTVQREWAGRIARDEEAGALLLLNANLICATPIGIAMAREFRDVETAFDVMIMDEASKASLTDFLVPAARARKWILVGDHRQLPPYVDVGELKAVISERVKRTGFEDPDDNWLDEVSTELRRHFDNRMHPDDRRQREAWRSLIDKLIRPFQLDPADIEELHALPADAGTWRQHHQRAGRHTGPGKERNTAKEQVIRLGAELLELQSLALPSVFERLTRLPDSRAVRLNYQHRMMPALARFSSDMVYEGDYPSAVSTHQLGLEIPTLEAPAIWIDTAYARPQRRYEFPRPTRNGTAESGKDWSGGGYHNPLELQVAMELVEACATWAVKSWRGDPRPNGRGPDADFEIGVTCFYLKQAQMLRDAIFKKLAPGNDPWRRQWKESAANRAAIDIHVSIVDRFQGREKDLVILCTTRSNPKGLRGHVDNLNRLNVAVTRARHKRIIIGDSTTLAGQGEGRRRAETDLLLRLYQDSEQKPKWGHALGGQA